MGCGYLDVVGKKGKSMRWTIFAFGLLLVACSTNKKATRATTPYPTNFSASDLENLEERTGTVLVYDGTIRQKEVSRNNTPAYLIDLGNQTELWSVLMFDNQLNQVGDSVRLVGYLVDNEDRRPDETYFGTHQKIVITFGMIDLKTSQLSFVRGADKQKAEWANGQIPKNK